MGAQDPKGPDAKPRCTATSKTAGRRCAQPPIPGGTVCHYHGGAAPQVKAKALQRLEAYQDRAIDALFELAETTEYPSVRYQAVKDVLDRTMGKAAESVRLTGEDGGPVLFQWQQ